MHLWLSLVQGNAQEVCVFAQTHEGPTEGTFVHSNKTTHNMSITFDKYKANLKHRHKITWSQLVSFLNSSDLSFDWLVTPGSFPSVLSLQSSGTRHQGNRS